MQVMARKSRKKTWQTGRQRVSVEATLAIQRENVVQRLLKLRVEIGHPEKPGEPLPQDQAAARAGVTARQWQRWESGASVPYARNLSAVADAFGFDVSEFYDGPAGREEAPTPTPFAGADGLADRLARIEHQTRS
jgi:transcriptional regulator with XRE-family HTH domain